MIQEKAVQRTAGEVGVCAGRMVRHVVLKLLRRHVSWKELKLNQLAMT